MKIERESDESLFDIIEYTKNLEEFSKQHNERLQALRLLAVQAENELHKRGIHVAT